MNTINLPTYPVTRDMWDELSMETRPIVVYGMGNGADKLIRRFEKYNIKISDFFASDGFVRGHTFHGYRVKSFSEIRETYQDFVIVLSFASSLGDVIDMISDINDRYIMYVPDMPIADESEYFDRTFYNDNFQSITRAYNSFSDDLSKHIFSSIINYKLSGRLSYLLDAYVLLDDIYSLLPRDSIETVIDAGAYNGDTAKEMKRYFSKLKTIYAIEPDTKNFKKLIRYSEAETDFTIKPINAVAWSENRLGQFSISGNRNSTAVATSSYESKSVIVEYLRPDTVTDERIDYIKYDVEGAEMEAIIGSAECIKAHSPSLLISLYHRSKDIFDIVNYIAYTYSQYNVYLRRTKCIPAWEIDLICVPKKSITEG